MLEELQKPFPPEALRQKKVSGKSFTYVPHDLVIRRIIAATKGDYSFEIVNQFMHAWGENKDGKPIYCHMVQGRLRIGDNYWDGHGVALQYPGGGEDMLKAAESDAIKKAATKIGVGLGLYGPDMEAELAYGQKPLEDNEEAATAEQKNFMRGLWKQLGYVTYDEKGEHHDATALNALLMQKFERDIDHLSKANAGTAIEGFQVWIKQRAEAAAQKGE